ncbi:helix-turn-helix transcriptional regulator [Breoghania sp. L-A4]|uniref:helix-turn-helix transcriptional regulator n=1 Tax=Breoghania sp. L-A4 TaxID=2304600 RepID=UPI000E359850|nr:helix-turn-helix transcriptional regulator [Breoghania sp. L-A4]AXS41628.1 helix-turn-helix domain-containing protein [Breoghania sp. L-A4]
MAEPENTAETELDDLAKKFFTTKQVASLLHVKERKIYELASAGEIPGTRALGKWLFDRQAIYKWLKSHGTDAGASTEIEPPNVVLGSHDPLLEWALRESNSGLATFLDGSLDGLERFGAGEGIANGMHVFDPASGDWNVPAIKAAAAGQPAALIEWAWRERGLIVPAGNPQGITGITDLAGMRVIPRQEKAGSQVLLQHYLDTELPGAVTLTRAARTESDAALAVFEGEADAAFGLQCVARQFRLDFVPIVRERFDLLVTRRDWFEPPLQRLMAFTRTPEFQARVAALTGYDVTGLGTVHFNGL